jgi:hypothetical protein
MQPQTHKSTHISLGSLRLDNPLFWDHSRCFEHSKWWREILRRTPPSPPPPHLCPPANKLYAPASHGMLLFADIQYHRSLSLSQEHCLRQNSLVACGSTIPTSRRRASLKEQANYCSSLRAADMFLVTKRSVVLRLKPMENLVNIILKQRRINGHHSKCSE